MPELSVSTRRVVKGATRDYDCSPLNDVAHEALNQYVQEAYMVERKRFIDMLSAGPQQDAAIRIAMHESIGLTWYNAIGIKFISTVDGMMRVLFEGCRINDKSLEFRAFKADIVAAYNSEAEAVRAARTTFDALNPSKHDPKAGGVAPQTSRPPKMPQRSRRKRSTRS